MPTCGFPAHSSTGQRPTGELHCESQSQGPEFRLPQNVLKELMPDGQTVESGVGRAHMLSEHALTRTRELASSYHWQRSESRRQTGFTKPSGTVPQAVVLQLPRNVTEDACEPASGDGAVAAEAFARSDPASHAAKNATVMPTSVACRTGVLAPMVPISLEYRDGRLERPVRAPFTRQRRIRCAPRSPPAFALRTIRYGRGSDHRARYSDIADTSPASEIRAI